VRIIADNVFGVDARPSLLPFCFFSFSSLVLASAVLIGDEL
jgi:hypothetical protein